MIKDHPSIDIQGTLSNILKDKKIILAISGSVAAVNSSELARKLIRHGAEVIPVMSSAACSLIHPDLMEWATGNKTITHLTGSVEHVMHAGNVKSKADLMLIYPSTANTLSKIANGIDDTPVTTFATTAIGEGIPIILVPAMHLPMYHHPAVCRNMEQLKKDGIQLIDPTLCEGKAKAATVDTVVETVLSRLSNKRRFNKKRVLITSGRTIEEIDQFRIISNRSSGKMGAELAKAALIEGAEVTLVTGAHRVTYPHQTNIIAVESCEEMKDAVEAELSKHSYDIMLAAAAVSDWRPETKSDGKISTDQSSFTLKLIPTPKIIDTVKEISPETFLTAFRAIPADDIHKMRENGYKRLLKANADLIAINPIGEVDTGFESDLNRFELVTKNKQHMTIKKMSKAECALQIVDFIAKTLDY